MINKTITIFTVFTVLSVVICAENLVPVNVGESIFEPFFDNYLTNADSAWRFTGKNGTEYKQSTLFGLNYTFTQKNTGKLGSFEFARDYKNLDCSDFNRIVLVIRARSTGQVIGIQAFTDAGSTSSKTSAHNDRGIEAVLNLPANAKKIKRIVCSVSAPKVSKGAWAGSIMYMSLRNIKKYDIYKEYIASLKNVAWNKLIKPANTEISYKMQYNLILNKDDATAFRDKYKNAIDSVKRNAETYKKLPDPAKLLDPYRTALWAGACRIQQRRKELGLPFNFNFSKTARNIAKTGYILKDKKLLRLAVRYAICLAMAKDWDSMGEMAVFPGGNRDQMAFRPSDVAYTICYIMDFAGEYLTESGREYLMKALARKGVGQVNYTTWKWNYIFHCNQMASFNYGRIAAYLVFERHWKHVRPYTKIAMDNLNESMDCCFTMDGGYLESPNYLAYTLYCARYSYLMYANMRGKKLSEVIPERMKKSGDFAQMIISTSKRPGHQIIPFGQSAKWHISCVSFLAAANPNSAWVNILDRVKNSRNDYGNIYNWISIRKLPEKHAKLKNFVLLKKAGLISSLRYYKNQPVKILLLGFNDKVGKRNEDIGSFVLEFAGNTFFMDPPVYHSKNVVNYQCQWHNMLVPYGKKEYHPMLFTKLWGMRAKKMAPEGSGDDKSFCAQVNVGKSWREGFRSHVRKIKSPEPDIIRIVDIYKLRSGTKGVNFYLQTYLPVAIKNNTIIVTGEFGGIAEICIPSGCKATLEKYTLQRVKGQCTRICISKPGKSGTLETTIRLKYD